MLKKLKNHMFTICPPKQCWIGGPSLVVQVDENPPAPIKKTQRYDPWSNKFTYLGATKVCAPKLLGAQKHTATEPGHQIMYQQGEMTTVRSHCYRKVASLSANCR